MSTFVTSKGTRGQHVSPRQCIPYRPSPARREAIHGRIVGIPDQREPRWWRVVSVVIMAVCTVYALKLAVIG